MTYSRTVEELAKRHSDGMKIFHVSVGKTPFEEACLGAKGVETTVDQHAIKEAYEMGYKAAKEELKQAAEAVKKQMAISKIKEFILICEGTTEEIAEALYEKGFRIE